MPPVRPQKLAREARRLWAPAVCRLLGRACRSGASITAGSGPSVRSGTAGSRFPQGRLARVAPEDAEPLPCPTPTPLQGRYDEEIEVYRHHLEQTYKLCRPCQAAVEYYLKHQNRQLRALLLSHQFRRREADQTHTQVGARPPAAFGGSHP